MSVQDGLRHSVAPVVLRSPHNKGGMLMGARQNDMVVTHLHVGDNAGKMEGRALHVSVQAEQAAHTGR